MSCRQRIALFSSTVFLLSSCALMPGSDAEQPYQGSIDWLVHEVSSQPLVVPADLTREVALGDRKTIHQRQEESIRLCMADQGFDYEVIPFPENGLEDRSLATYYDGMPPLGDVDAARNEGYGPPPTGKREEPDQNDNLSEDYYLALIGEKPVEGAPGVIRIDDIIGHTLVQTNSCVGKANDELFGSGDLFTKLNLELDGIRMEMERAAANDSNFVEAKKKWHECMSERGFDVQSPEIPWKTLSESFRRGEIDEGEYYSKSKESSVDNAECINESGFVASYNAATEKAARVVGVRAEATLTAYLELTKDALGEV